MGLGKQIRKAMNESYDEKIDRISQLIGVPVEKVRNVANNLQFKSYVAVMSALNNEDTDTLKTFFGDEEETTQEATTQGTQGTVNPNAQQRPTPYQQARAQVQDPEAQMANDPTKRAQAMQRLGKKNLGGVSAQQAAQALDKAEQGRALTGMQRKAIAGQAKNMDALASDPKTASQFRQLLNRLNK